MASNTSLFKFVHTADVHLGSPLRSMAARDKQLARRVQGATIKAFEAIVDLCLDESVDALLVAGDLHDGYQKSMSIAAKLRAQLKRLQAANIPVYMIRGNHDSMSTVQNEVDLPDNVFVFGAKDKPISLNNGQIVIHGVSFKSRTAAESLLPKYTPPIPDAINIGLLHTSLAGSSAHDVYAPCSVSELANFGYDYWALGHIHTHEIHNTNPMVVMPGIPQGRDIGEHGPCSVTLAEFDHDRNCITQQCMVGSAQFEKISLSIDEDKYSNSNDLADLVFEKLEKLLSEIEPLDLIARVEINASGPFLYKLHRDKLYLEELLFELTAPNDALWLESIHIVEDRSTSENNQSSVGLRELYELIGQSPENALVLEQAREELAQLVRKLPSELKSDFQFSSQEEEDNYLKNAINKGGEFLFAHLQSST